MNRDKFYHKNHNVFSGVFAVHLDKPKVTNFSHIITQHNLVLTCLRPILDCTKTEVFYKGFFSKYDQIHRKTGKLHFLLMLPSLRNQSTDLQRPSTEWFLYGGASEKQPAEAVL